MRINKVNWITAHNCGKPKWHSFTTSLRWKGKFWASTLSHKMCPRKQTTELKLLILVTFFSDTSYCIHIMLEVCRSIFYGPPCIVGNTCSINVLWQKMNSNYTERQKKHNFLEWCPLKSTASKWMIFGLMLATVLLITHVKTQRNWLSNTSIAIHSNSIRNHVHNRFALQQTYREHEWLRIPLLNLYE